MKWACHLLHLLKTLWNRRKYHIEQRFVWYSDYRCHLCSLMIVPIKRNCFVCNCFLQKMPLWVSNSQGMNKKRPFYYPLLTNVMSLNNSHKVLAFISPRRKEFWVDLSFTLTQMIKNNNHSHLDFYLQVFSNNY